MLKRKIIDNNKKTGIMLAYIDPSQNVVAIEPGWNMTPVVLAKLLKDLYPNKQAAIELVDSAVMVPVFRKEDYEYLDGFGGVLESNLNFYEHNLRPHIGHLFCHMTGIWKYSNDGIYWDPITEVFTDNSGFQFSEVREAVEVCDASKWVA